MSQSPPANWYPDPEVATQQRYWDGNQWTEHVAPYPDTPSAGGNPAAADPAVADVPVPATEVVQGEEASRRAVSALPEALPLVSARPERPRVFSGGKYTDALEEENRQLRAWVEHMDESGAVELQQQISDAEARRQELGRQIESLRSEVLALEEELRANREALVETDDVEMLQEIGLYEFTHPLDDSPVYKERLSEARGQIKELVRAHQAVTAITTWMVNNSAAEGRRMVSETSKLMLNAYNAEVDNVIRTLKPYKLSSAIDRVTKTRDKIAKLGRSMQIQIAPAYHDLRVYEVQLTADYMQKVADEKEAQREERARQREEEKAQREFEAEKARLRKEQAHYEGALEKFRESGDQAKIAELETRLDGIAADLTAVESREANLRAGHVYVISNIGAFGDHVVKTGMTRRLDPEDRVRELGDASVPFRYDIHALIFSSDAVSLETQLHQRFARARINRVNTRREFFAVSPSDVRDALSEIDDQYLLRFHETPEAEEWRASLNIAAADKTAAPAADQ